MTEPNLLIAATASKGFFQWAIRKLTGSPYNHVMVLYECPFWKGWWAIQVDDHGVRPVPLEKAWKDVTGYVLFKSAMELRDDLPTMRRDMDKDYDYAGIFGFFVKIMAWRVAKKRIRNVFHKKGDLFCSEFMAKFFRKAHVPEAEELKPATTAPSDIVEFCTENHTFKKTSLKTNKSLAVAISFGKIKR